LETFADRNRLIQEVLEELKVVAVGQPASAAEIATVNNGLDSALMELTSRRIIAIGTAAEIPMEYLGALSQTIGRMMANKFSLTSEETDAMFEKVESPTSPENRLRAMKAQRAAWVRQTPDYF
jgi:hypothetical protein